MRDLWKLLAYLAEDLVPFLSHSNSPEALDFIEKNGLIYQQFNTIAAVRVWQWPLKCHQLSIISTDWIAKNPTSSCRFIGSERSLFYCLSLLLNNTRYKHARKNKRLKLVPSSGSLLNESNRRIKEIDGYEQLDFSSERWQQLFKDFCRDSFWKRKKKKKKKDEPIKAQSIGSLQAASSSSRLSFCSCSASLCPERWLRWKIQLHVSIGQMKSTQTEAKRAPLPPLEIGQHRPIE